MPHGRDRCYPNPSFGDTDGYVVDDFVPPGPAEVIYAIPIAETDDDDTDATPGGGNNGGRRSTGTVLSPRFPANSRAPNPAAGDGAGRTLSNAVPPRDADGYVEDAFVPGGSASGDPEVHATDDGSGRNNVDAGAATEYAVPVSDDGTIGVYAPTAIVESNV